MIDKLNILSWNCKGVMSAVPYLNSCLERHQIDVCALSEHWLRTCNIHFLQQINHDYKPYYKSVDEYLPMSEKCTNYRKGVALMVSKEIDRYVSREIDIDSDRIVGIEINIPNVTTIYLFCVYLPAVTLPLEQFKDQMNTLHELYYVYSQCGKVIVAGDFNAQIRGPRYECRIGDRGNILQDFLREFQLISLNMQDSCVGPTYTFQGYVNGPSSTIDHIVVNEEIGTIAENISVLHDNDIVNVSDHLPIICSIELDSLATAAQSVQMPTKIAWDKALSNGSVNDFTFAVSQNLWTVNIKQTNIEEYNETIVKALKDASTDTLPIIKFRKHLKPYWNSQLSNLHDDMIQHRNVWVQENRPRGFENETFRNYKKSKNEFRNASREAYNNYVNDVSNEIEHSLELDHRLAWTIIRGRKVKSSSDINLKVDNRIINNPEQVSEEFAKFFENIAKSTFKESDNEMAQKLQNIRERCGNEEITRIEIDELKELVTKLPLKKACGLDGIFYEHIKYGGHMLMKHLCALFNLILVQCKPPESWKTSVVIPLFKGGGKSKANTESYRGISLIPCICKLFEKLIDNRLTETLENFPNKQQVAYQKNLSSIHASYCLQETVSHYRERRTSTKVVFLDSKKAFDTVDHCRLKIKLNDLGIHGKLWKLLDNMYMNMKSCVKCNNCLSKPFSLERGVRQGSALSAKLYLIYVNGLIEQLTESGYGAVMIDLQVGNPVQADDIALIASTYKGLQNMIDICYQYSINFKFEFSPKKSQVMLFECRANPMEPKTDLKLNNDIIPVHKSVKHVGILLDAKLNSLERTQTACKTIRAVCMSVIRLGVHPSILNPITCSKILLQLCYSKGLYGSELWNNLNQQELILLERTHRFICKYVQGLPKLTRTDKCTSLLGWTSIECIIDINKLLFMGRLVNMPTGFLPKDVFMSRLLMYHHNCTIEHYGFIQDIIRIINKYELCDFIDNLLSKSEFPVQNRWKRIVKSRIQESEENLLKQRMANDIDFMYFKVIHNRIQPHRAWTILRMDPSLKKQSKFVVSLCTLIKPQDELILCHKCGFFFDNPIVHMIAQCSSLVDTRDMFWTDLIAIGPIELSTSLHQMDDINLTLTILSCDSDKVYEDLHQDEKDNFTCTCIKYIYKLCNQYHH